MAGAEKQSSWDRVREWGGRRFLALAFLVFALGWGASLWPLALERTLPGARDSDLNRNLPFRAFVLQSLAEHRIPEFAAGMFGGHAILSHGQLALLYPSNLAGYALRIPDYAFLWLDVWLHGTLAAAGVAWLLRRRAVPMWACLALGWAYANSSAFLFRLDGHWTLVHQAALMPWLLGAWEAMDALRERAPGGANTRRLAAFSIVLALMLLAQNPQWLYALALALAPLEAWRMVRRRSRMRPASRVVRLGVATMAAAILGAASLVPLAASMGDSFRSLLGGPSFSRGWPLHPFNWISLVSPGFLFGERLTDFWGRWWYNESVIITGRAAALFAVAGAATFCARPARWLGRGALPLVLIAVGLLLGVSPVMPWHEGLGRILPLYESFRAWGRAGILVILGIILLAGEGMRAAGSLLSRGKLRRTGRWTALAFAIALCLASAMASWVVKNDGPGALAWMARHGLEITRFQEDYGRMYGYAAGLPVHLRNDALFYAAWAAGLGIWMVWFSRRRPMRMAAMVACLGALALATLETTAFQRFVFTNRTALLTPGTAPKVAMHVRDLQFERGAEPLTVAFTHRAYLNFALFFPGVRSLSGEDVNVSASYAQWLNEIQGLPPTTNQLDSLITRWPSALVEATGLHGKFMVPGDPGANGQHCFVYNDLLACRQSNPFPPAYADFPDWPSSGAPATTQAAVQSQHWGEGRVSLKVENPGPDPVLLRVREFFNPRWRVRVNGTPVAARPFSRELPVLAFEVPSGPSEVEMVFVDTWARIGYGISLLAWLALAALFLWARIRQKKSDSRICESA